MSGPQIFRVVYDDQDILLIEKKKAFISQRSDSSGQEGLYEFISRSLGYSVWPVHRLDREVLGLMVFAKTLEASEDLSLQFKTRKIRKSYSAWVHGQPLREQDRLIHYLKKNEKTNHTTVFPRPTPGAKEAVLSYRVEERRPGFTRLKIDLETGRSHQIRAQLAKIECPIVGDSRYGKKKFSDFPSPQIHLKSCRLGFFQTKNSSYFEWNLPPIELSL